MEKIRIYYNKKSTYLCQRYPLNLEIDEDSNYIEVSEDKALQTYDVDYGYSWAVVDGKLTVIEVPEIMETTEYKKITTTCKIQEYKSYLSETDYVVSKINEAMVDDEDEANALKEKYSVELKTRKEYRTKIKELEALLETLNS